VNTLHKGDDDNDDNNDTNIRNTNKGKYIKGKNRVSAIAHLEIKMMNLVYKFM
jgi:hypothetical protein